MMNKSLSLLRQPHPGLHTRATLQAAPRPERRHGLKMIYLCYGRSPQTKGSENDGRVQPLDIYARGGRLVGGIDYPVGQYGPRAQQNLHRGQFRGEMLMQRCQIDRIFISKPITAGTVGRVLIGSLGVGVVTTGEVEFQAYHAVGVVMMRECRRENSQDTRQQQRYYFQLFRPHKRWSFTGKVKSEWP